MIVSNYLKKYFFGSVSLSQDVAKQILTARDGERVNVLPLPLGAPGGPRPLGAPGGPERSLVKMDLCVEKLKVQIEC